MQQTTTPNVPSTPPPTYSSSHRAATRASTPPPSYGNHAYTRPPRYVESTEVTAVRTTRIIARQSRRSHRRPRSSAAYTHQPRRRSADPERWRRSRPRSYPAGPVPLVAVAMAAPAPAQLRCGGQGARAGAGATPTARELDLDEELGTVGVEGAFARGRAREGRVEWTKCLLVLLIAACVVAGIVAVANAASADVKDAR